MTDRTEWEGRVGRKWAEEWPRTDRSFAPLTERLLAVLVDERPRQVLDIGCGAGELSLALARMYPSAEVLGLDVSEPLVAAARERTGELPNISFEVADAATWRRDGFAPDLLVSRHGVMSFADPVGAFSHLASIAAPSARLVFSCFRNREHNPWATKIANLTTTDAPSSQSDEPGPFAFANPDRVERILAEAGWEGVEFEPVDFAYVAGAGDDALQDAATFFKSIGPAARAASELKGSEREDFDNRLRSLLTERCIDGTISFPASAWIVSARLVSV
ncbi:class I SAM-dependent methyltransferase [Tsuneonella amylolytica]|uniref:class I SAM-dependent methyltransferase n=1 Tax=Tsuneonella amylolytica TaxID=2338327 RepID=UPI000EA9CEFC|nr:class I SAM-dependent methyltransferase [Tsuneonella amylolytica]